MWVSPPRHDDEDGATSARLDLIERTLRGANEGDEVGPGAVTDPALPTPPSHERRLAERIVSALDRMADEAPSALSSAEVADTLERVLRRLDELVTSCVVDRLAATASTFATHLDASGWWVGRSDQESLLTRVAGGVRRESPDGRRLGLLLDAEAVRWEDPRTAKMLEGGSYVAFAGESPAVAARLKRWGGAATAVAAGGYDLDARQWAVCLIGDRVSPDLRHAQAALSAAVQVAMGFPRAPRS